MVRSCAVLMCRVCEHPLHIRYQLRVLPSLHHPFPFCREERAFLEKSEQEVEEAMRVVAHVICIDRAALPCHQTFDFFLAIKRLMASSSCLPQHTALPCHQTLNCGAFKNKKWPPCLRWALVAYAVNLAS